MVLLLIGMVNHKILLLILISSLILIYGFRIQPFQHAVRRMRWLFLSMMMIYAFATPGELIPYFPADFAPTYEGLLSGWIQVERLLIALAALSLLLLRSSRQQLMLGLYMLLSPFRLVGLNVERFAARLMLTLDYVEEFAASDKSGFNIRQLAEVDAHVESLPQLGFVTFQKQPFALMDKLMLMMFSLVCVYMVYQGFA